jgi:Tol biopolymer transport system component
LHKHLPNARITIWWIIGIVIVGMLVVVGVLMKTGILTFTSAQMPGTKGQLNSPVSEANGYLYFTSDKNGKAEIWMMDPKGQIVQVTHTPDPYESWSPAPAANGYIYFTSDKNGKAEVWMMDPKGQIVQVTHTPDPDESWVFYFNKPHSNPKR